MKYIRTFLLTSVVLAMVGIAFAQTPAKPKVDIWTNPPKLDRKINLTQEQFQEQTQIFTEPSELHKNYGFTVRLPQSWKKQDAGIGEGEVQSGLSNALLVGLAAFTGPVSYEGQSSLRVKGQQLYRSTSAYNWMANYILDQGYTLNGIAGLSHTRAEADYIVVLNGQSYLVRAVAIINAPHVILAEYMVPISLSEKERSVQVWSIGTLRPVAVSAGSIEPIEKYEYLDNFIFEYPASWIFQPAIMRTSDRLEGKLLNVRGGRKKLEQLGYSRVILDGKIDFTVHAIKPELDLKKEITILRDALKKDGFMIGDLLETRTNLRVHEGFPYQRTDIYKINNPGKNLLDHEYWVTLVKNDKHIIVLTMVTPGREQDRSIWLNNIDGFQEIIARLKPL
ncbi:MAG: hypothetical protein GC136_07295 [Alphaproteobacteria bacterium]|nr:hypothetical protein [Alphaproteobacteria bacterium]